MKKVTTALLVLLPFIFIATSVEAHWYRYRPYRSWRIRPYGYSHYYRHTYRTGDKAFWGGLAGGLLGSFIAEVLLSPPTWKEARQEPQERCDWYYDSEGRWRWQCQGSEWRTRGSGPPLMPLPPPELPAPSLTSTYSTSNPAPSAQLEVRQQEVSPTPRRKKHEYPPARVIADCKRTPEHPACQGW